MMIATQCTRRLHGCGIPHRSRRWLIVTACIVLVVVFAPRAKAQPERARRAPAQEQSPRENRPVAATIDGEAIFADEVDESLAVALAGRQISTEALPALRAQALQQLIGRRLIEAYLLEQGYRPSESQVEQQKAQLISGLRAKRISLKRYLAERNMTEEQLVRRLTGQLAWQTGWSQYLAQNLSDERFEEYVDAQSGEFDGTERRASHILLQVDRPQDPSAVREKVEQARAIRNEVVDGKLSFSAAVEKYSDGPSRRHQGDLGFFPRHGVMDEAFAKAAFALDEGAFSEPVATPFGIHLIQCTAIKPGDKTWADIKTGLTPLERKALIDAVAREVFAELAARLRSEAKIEFTGNVPYLDPESRELRAVGSGRAESPSS